MKISRPTFSYPVLCIDNFLEDAEASQILNECIDLKKVYMPARIFSGTTSTTIDTNVRRNQVIYLDEVFRGAPERSDILRLLRAKIWTDECRALWHEGGYIFDIINYATWHEMTISRYGEDEFYAKHQDTRWDYITLRIVTLIYYVNKTPEGFAGGALRLFKDDQYLDVVPKHNRAVLFPSFEFHRVEPVHLLSDLWEDARYSVNYWLGFR